MTELKVSREVGAPPEAVWGVITDVGSFAETISAVEAVERLDDGTGFDVGTRWRETRKMFGRQATEEMEVTNVDAGRSYVTEAESHGAHYRAVTTVEPRGESGSLVTMTFGATPRSTVAKIADATIGRFFRGATAKALQKDLDDIAAAAQARTA